MKLPHFTIRELFLITVIVALGVALLYKRMESRFLDLSFSEVERIVKRMDSEIKLLGGGGDRNRTEMEILVPSASADQFVARFKQHVDQIIDKGGWTSTTSEWGGDEFTHILNQFDNNCVVDFRLLDRKKADDIFKQVYSKDYDMIRFLLITVQTR